MDTKPQRPVRATIAGLGLHNENLPPPTRTLPGKATDNLNRPEVRRALANISNASKPLLDPLGQGPIKQKSQVLSNITTQNTSSTNNVVTRPQNRHPLQPKNVVPLSASVVAPLQQGPRPAASAPNLSQAAALHQKHAQYVAPAVSRHAGRIYVDAPSDQALQPQPSVGVDRSLTNSGSGSKFASSSSSSAPSPSSSTSIEEVPIKAPLDRVEEYIDVPNPHLLLGEDEALEKETTDDEYVQVEIPQYVRTLTDPHSSLDRDDESDTDEAYTRDGYPTDDSADYEDGPDVIDSPVREHSFDSAGPDIILNNRIVRELADAHQWAETTGDDDMEDFCDYSMASEYRNDIFPYMRHLEDRMRPDSSYMARQTEIEWPMRAVLVDWLVQVHYRFSLLPETLFLAINIVDRFLSVKVVSVGKLQLVGATAILVAAKYEEISCPSLLDMAFMVDNGYTTDEILKAERFLLSLLQFELGWPGPMSFLRRISKADDYDWETRTLAKYFLEVAIMEHEFVATRPSLLAAASHCMARLLLGKGKWTLAHVYYSQYTYEQLRPILAIFLSCCRQPEQHHASVYDKYSHSRYSRASLFVKDEITAGFALPFVLELSLTVPAAEGTSSSSRDQSVSATPTDENVAPQSALSNVSGVSCLSTSNQESTFPPVGLVDRKRRR